MTELFSVTPFISENFVQAFVNAVLNCSRPGAAPIANTVLCEAPASISNGPSDVTFDISPGPAESFTTPPDIALHFSASLNPS